MQIDWAMVSALAQVVGFVGIVWALYLNWRALQTHVAMDFYRRFADIVVRMPTELRLAGYNGQRFIGLSEEKKTAVALSLIEYVNLCSEEFALYRSGRLASDAWSVTSAEIQRNFTSPLWRDVWTHIRREYESTKEFADYIDSRADVTI